MNGSMFVIKTDWGGRLISFRYTILVEIRRWSPRLKIGPTCSSYKRWTRPHARIFCSQDWNVSRVGSAGEAVTDSFYGRDTPLSNQYIVQFKNVSDASTIFYRHFTRKVPSL
jgi:hypothetical protein